MPDANLNHVLLFSLSGILAMIGWIILLVSPLIPSWSDRISGSFIPLVLSAGYVVLAVFFPSGSEGGFGSLEAVITLFSHPQCDVGGLDTLPCI